MRGLPIAAAFMGLASCAVALRAVEGAKALEEDDRSPINAAHPERRLEEAGLVDMLAVEEWTRAEATRTSLCMASIASVLRAVPCGGKSTERLVSVSLPALEAR